MQVKSNGVNRLVTKKMELSNMFFNVHTVRAYFNPNADLSLKQ